MREVKGDIFEMFETGEDVIAVWKGTNGGTGNCVKYAKKKSSCITQLHPFTLEVIENI